MNRLLKWVAIAAVAFGLIALGFNGVPPGHPLTGLVSFLRIVTTAALIVGALVLVLAVFVPRVRQIITPRKFRTGGRGLTKEEKAALTPGEMKSLKRMTRTREWGEAAGLSRDGKDRQGREFTTSPGLVASELNTRGPAVVVQIVKGTLPSDYTSERVSAALGLSVECEPSGPAQVRVQLLSRDPFKGTRTSQTVGKAPTAPDQPIVLDDWTDLDFTENEK